MKDIIRLNEIKPLQAEGRCTVELTDPITGKVKERVGGKNMVFPETLMVDKWWDVLSDAYTVLGDDDTPSSLDFPYMRGKPLGYGIPSTAGSGLYQGAYNPSNQILKRVSDGKLSWKFQYDFTAPQSLGTIKAVSLTRQYNTGYNYGKTTQFYSATNSVDYDYFDGRYGYIIGTDGVVEIADMYFGGVETINISATVGATGNKSIFIDKASGTTYVLKSTTNNNHTLYKFTDKTFTTLSSTYTLTNTRNTNSKMFLAKGDYIFVLEKQTDNKFTKIDYTTDTVVGTIPVISNSTDIFGKATSLYHGDKALHINDNFIMFLHKSTSPYRCEIFDLVNEKFVAGVHLYYNSNLLFANHYYAEHPLPCYASGQMEVLPTAFTNYVLPTPVEKTNDKGMTVTYELDVYW